jgi:hypothetical protein
MGGILYRNEDDRTMVTRTSRRTYNGRYGPKGVLSYPTFKTHSKNGDSY